jgi:hypothetical protein
MRSSGLSAANLISFESAVCRLEAASRAGRRVSAARAGLRTSRLNQLTGDASGNDVVCRAGAERVYAATRIVFGLNAAEAMLGSAPSTTIAWTADRGLELASFAIYGRPQITTADCIESTALECLQWLGLTCRHVSLQPGSPAVHARVYVDAAAIR